MSHMPSSSPFFFFQAEDGIRDADVTGVQTCALPISTGQIFRQRTRAWEPERFASFCAVYVNGFMDAYAALRARGGDPAAFSPSSVAVGEAAAELAEYRIAKAAGEMACAEIDRGARRKRGLITGLPRIGTDQTMTTG